MSNLATFKFQQLPINGWNTTKMAGKKQSDNQSRLHVLMHFVRVSHSHILFITSEQFSEIRETLSYLQITSVNINQQSLDIYFWALVLPHPGKLTIVVWNQGCCIYHRGVASQKPAV